MGEKYYLKPIIKSLGGKSWFKEIAWVFYSRACKSRKLDMRWVDPFCGGLSVPFYIMPNEAWLNDANIYLINLYNYIVEKGEMPDFSNDINEEEFYIRRSRFNENIKNGVTTGKEMAELFYYLNKACYGGISRYNNSGFFNAPFSKVTTSSLKTDFSYEQRALSEWLVTSLNYSDVIQQVQKNDFLFVDPPYDETYNKYIKRTFSWDDQVELATSLSKLDNPILATNSTSERIYDLYMSLGFEVQYKQRRNYLQNGLTRKPRAEKYKEAVFIKNIQI